MKNKILLFLVLICTVFLTAFPVSQLYHKYHTQQQVSSLERKIAEDDYPSKKAVEKDVQQALEARHDSDEVNRSTSSQKPLETKREASESSQTKGTQNETTSNNEGTHKETVTDVFEETSSHDFEASTYTGAVGYVYIPKINSLEMLYLGASQQNLYKGVAQMSQTSLPLSGIGHQTVIAGHRGGYTSAQFLYVDQLSAGDHIYIDYLGEKAVYTVTRLDVIRNYGQNGTLTDIPNLDMLTLYTCHPYPQNYERLLVRSLRDNSAPFYAPQTYSTNYKYKDRQVEVPNEPTYDEQLATYNETPALNKEPNDSNRSDVVYADNKNEGGAKADNDGDQTGQAIAKPKTTPEKISYLFTKFTNGHQTLLLTVWAVLAGLWTIRILVLLVGEFRKGRAKA